MNDVEMVKFVHGLQVTANMVLDGVIDRAIEEIERRRRNGVLPLMGDAALFEFLSLCRDVAALKPKMQKIAEAGTKFEQFIRAGQSGLN